MDLTSLVLQHLPARRKSNPSGGFYICCPMCQQMGEPRPDTKFRGGFTQEIDGGFIYHCYNCRYATRWSYNGRVSKNLMKFLTQIGIQPREIPIGLRLLRPGESLTTAVEKKSESDVVLDFEPMKLPPQAKSLEEWSQEESLPDMLYQAIEYLAKRGDAVLNGWTYYWTPHDKFSWNQRIIIPFYHHSRIVGYTGRLFTNKPGLSKYYSRQPSDYLFNQDKLENDSEIVILTEGVLDAIAIRGLAVLGNSLTDKQINLLKRSGKDIILVPDRSRTGRNLVEQAIENNWKVSIPSPEDWNDVEDCAAAVNRFGLLYTIESILDSTYTSAMKIRTRFETSRL